jgi:hypothetical protein
MKKAAVRRKRKAWGGMNQGWCGDCTAVGQAAYGGSGQLICGDGVHDICGKINRIVESSRLVRASKLLLSERLSGAGRVNTDPNSLRSAVAGRIKSISDESNWIDHPQVIDSGK